MVLPATSSSGTASVVSPRRHHYAMNALCYVISGGDTKACGKKPIHRRWGATPLDMSKDGDSRLESGQAGKCRSKLSGPSGTGAIEVFQVLFHLFSIAFVAGVPLFDHCRSDSSVLLRSRAFRYRHDREGDGG